MDEIPYVNGAPFFANGGGNPYTMDSPLQRLQNLIEQDVIAEGSPAFIYYLDRMSEEMVDSFNADLGPDPMVSLPMKLFYELNNGTDFPDEKYEFYVFYLLCKLHEEIDDYQGMRDLIERLEPRFDDEQYFGKVKARAFSNSADPDDLRNSIEVAFQYSSDYPEYLDLKKTLSEMIVICVEEGVRYEGSVLAIPTGETELLELADRSINDAVSSEIYPAEYTLVHSQVEALKGNYEAAKTRISNAISELSRNRGQYTELKAEFGLVRNKILAESHKSELDERTEQISDSLSSLDGRLETSRNDINELNKEIDGIRQDFQRTILEFLGFFSAIIAVVVITGQIALSINDPQEAGRLFLVSYGGLLFAFGGFATILASENSSRYTRGALSTGGLIVAMVLLYSEEITAVVF
ncbi:hypothetical protein [Halobacterium sp. KA-6]|uniref:hypothetical protein n=1 Tax=Halobacterium sp. KA-6 TaxID=2896368 RepID=UPI001E2F1595|nr:hypothetical protein [Halobacterium sp. KA-6]MCD2204544.1 hypothetical protein [Halobacterium sp. KA-6]